LLAGWLPAQGAAGEPQAARAAATELELKIVVGENPIDVGGIVSLRIVVTNFGAEPVAPVRLHLMTDPVLVPLGGRGASAMHIAENEVTVDPIPALDSHERAEWFLVLATERAGIATISATTNTGEKTLLAQALVNVEGSAPAIAIERAETLFETARADIETGRYEDAIEKLRSAVTQFDNPMFKASAYFLMSVALQRLGRVYEAHQQQQITRVLLSHSFTPASRWIPEIVHMTDLRDLETQDDDTYTRLYAPRPVDSAVTGRVYAGSERTPIAGAVVSLDGAGGIAAATDEQGYFVLHGMPADYYSITVTSPGFQTRTRGNIDVRDSTTKRVDFRLVDKDGGARQDIAELAQDEGGRLVGRVMAAVDQAPLGEATVFFEGPQRTLVTTDRYGRFSLNGIAPGTYTATWSKPGYFRVTRFNVAVEPGRTTTLETEMSADNATTARR
jgi:hypothetical protein